MSRFDLSNATDFSRLTQQSLGDIVRLVDGRDPSQWDILEGSYNGIVFHVFQTKVDWQGAVSRIQDGAGRRKVKYQFPYRDGQTTDDLGRRAGSFQMEILIHGLRYMRGFTALMAEFDKPTPGTLIHPIRGQINVAVDDVQISYSSEQRKAVLLNVTFIEHNFTIGNLSDLKDSSVKGALSRALDVFKTIDAAIRKVEQVQPFTRGVKNRINSFLNVLKQDNAKVLTQMNQTFNLGAGSSDIPSLVPVNQGGTRASDGTLSNEYFQVVRSVSDPFNNVPVEAVSASTAQALAVIQIKNDIESLRAQTAATIREIETAGGSLEMFDEIIGLRQTVVLVQDVFELGVSSSNARVVDYTVPRLMTLREIAFENGISPQRVQELDLLNPELLSTNFVEAGTVLKVPVS